ncbi:MAG: ROK family protein [Chloroflexota bacterium]
MKRYGGLEAGGTKFVCVVGSGPHDLQAEERFPTTHPDQTLPQVIEYFRRQAAIHPLSGIGVACFGPVDLNPDSPTYGSITTTPKPGWANTDIVHRLEDALQTPVAFDTDVNGAALGEYRWGAGVGSDPCLYITIGTGVGGGAIVNGRPLRGLVHPEMGHLRLAHDRQVDPFPGACPFHGDCFEGLASGTAMNQRWGRRAETLPADHPAWELEAHYIAQAVAGLICTLSPKKIILGGGVMQDGRLFPSIRRQVQTLLNGYVQSPAILNEIDQYIVPPGLGNQAGGLGSIALAMEYAARH